MDMFEDEHQMSDDQIMQQLMQERQAQMSQGQPDYQQNQSNTNANMSEVEQRLRRAQYYNTVLGEWLFTDDYTQPAQEVMGEIREFITQRLNVLLGVTPENQALMFTEQEVMALKRVAATALQKFGNLVSSPQYNQATTQAPRQAPKLKKIASPQLNQRQAPRQGQQQNAQPMGQPPTKKEVGAPGSARQMKPAPPSNRLPMPTGDMLASTMMNLAQKQLEVANNTDDGMALNKLGLK